MAKNSNIEWTDHTNNLWWGCSKVHAGCKNCYAEKLSNRFGNEIWGEKVGRKRIKSWLSDLAKYQAIGRKTGVRQKVFIGSMMDIFEDTKELINATPEYKTTEDLRQRLFDKIVSNCYDSIIFLFLTKRPENIVKYTNRQLRHMNNVWIGTSISDKKSVFYGSVLTKQDVRNTFLSIEPQIENISLQDLRPFIQNIDWIIQGGESGRNAREFNLDWAKSLRISCEAFQVPYFFKQIDKKQEIPPEFLIRQFPEFN